MAAKRPPSAMHPAPATGLVTWFHQALDQPELELRLKLRGNILHVLCETPESLPQAPLLLRLVRALLRQGGVQLIQQLYPHVYQLYLYHRVTAQEQPDWTAPLYLNRLERHLAQLVLQTQDPKDIQAAQGLLQAHPDELMADHDAGDGAIVLSQLSLARQGDPEAVAWYLSETLSALDVGVWVSIKAVPGQAHISSDIVQFGPPPPVQVSNGQGPVIPRLWVLCQATYSPDPALIAQPTAERLRQLELTQFKDAVLLLQVQGEAKPDWRLRIDLTPPQEMLREWARWGHAEAIRRLVQAALTAAGLAMTVTASRKDTTLHLIGQGEADPLPSAETVLELLQPLLDGLAPQGLHRALLYGQTATAEMPDWVQGVDLPGADHPALAVSARTLAAEADLPALAFLLTQQLNPQLDDYLATGGIRVQLLIRNQLLHVMLDGPLCPVRSHVAPIVGQLLKRLRPQGIIGVRLYGRRAGQSQPTWSGGFDFQARQRLVPEATPEFAASDSYVGELLAPPEAEVQPAEAAPDTLGHTLRQWAATAVTGVQKGLLHSHLFASRSTPGQQPLRAGGDWRIAMVWAVVGLLLTVQADWLLGELLSSPPAATAEANETADQQDPGGAVDPEAAAFEEALDDLEWGADDPRADRFVAEPFATSPPAGARDATDQPPASPTGPLVATSILLEASPYPSFRSEQLNEKLALYHQRLQLEDPPDVLIMGSSRALRGVDPTALEEELAALGYEGIEVFNFGVNGATAQVVELIIRRLLPPDYLPRLILWADGARAFNSGRVDITYNGIATSEGYRQMVRGTLPHDTPEEAGETDPEAAAAAPGEDPAADIAVTSQGIGEQLRSSYQQMDQWLSDQLGTLSAVHPERQRLKEWLQAGLVTLTTPPSQDPAAPPPADGPSDPLDAPLPEGSHIDFDGFLPLSVQFNPATYYQKHARVSGYYDSDYRSFRLEGRQAEAFQRLLQFTQSQDIPLVFVNTPLTDEYLDPYRLDAETQFLQYMVRLSGQEEGFIFRDLAQIWPEEYDYFSDPSHLNRYGAYQVSTRLAQDPMIPWPEPMPETTP
ncbi:hypothetical protein XM38_003500 [Halomicronema hongdechloris C2206]|uniref:DUF1574 domain-containing protein n=1 Tax=Halomicronema hongdechloris C2206 TaxID=1641165 RepID=A0A1Z3HGI7_9CYAN|nr:DUF1574 domain-containing protein [Halomicronema hongdechloris]ASC69423.1 hypothetical protein XM38_003500 [Halomicronema hongdechloris C2206]